MYCSLSYGRVAINMNLLYGLKGWWMKMVCENYSVLPSMIIMTVPFLMKHYPNQTNLKEHPYIDDTSILEDMVCGLLSRPTTKTMALELPGIYLDIPTVIIHAAPSSFDEPEDSPNY